MSQTNGHPVTREEVRQELRKELRKELGRVLKKYATQAGLERTQESVNRLARAVGDLNTRVSSLEDRMATKDDINRIMKVLDGMATHNKQCWAKLVVHEQRITALEER